MISFIAALGQVGQTFMWIWWTLWVILFLALIVVLFKNLIGSHSSKTSPTKSAMDILKERYAKGEINKQEFEERKQDLY
jgi:putative membrane protein